MLHSGLMADVESSQHNDHRKKRHKNMKKKEVSSLGFFFYSPEE